MNSFNPVYLTSLYDNGTQFITCIISELPQNYRFTVMTSSSHYPKDYGLIERYVQTIKKTLIKFQETREDIFRMVPIKSNISQSRHEVTSGVAKCKEI